MKKFFYVIAVICLLCVIGCSEKNDPATPKTDELTITSISPDNGVEGDVVEIFGTGFGSNPANIEVSINSQKLTLLETAPTKLKLSLPYNPADTYPVKIKVGDKEATGPDFTYTTPEVDPTAITCKPTIGEPGTIITISGSGFSTTASENSVTINGKEAEVVSASEEELTVIAPENEEGTETKIIISVNGGEPKETENSFRYGAFLFEPKIEILPNAFAEVMAFADDNTLVFGNFGGDSEGVSSVYYAKLSEIGNANKKVFCPRITTWSNHNETGRIKRMEPYGDKIYFAFYRDNAIGSCDFIASELDGNTDFSTREVTKLDITGLNAPIDIRFDAEGNMYVAGRNNKAVLKFNKGNYTGSGETVANFTNSPLCIDFDWDGKLVVAEHTSNKLYRVDNGTLTEIATLPYEILSLMIDVKKKDIYASCSNQTAYRIRLGGEPQSIAEGNQFYGLRMSPARDAIYCGTPYTDGGALFMIPLTLE